MMVLKPLTLTNTIKASRIPEYNLAAMWLITQSALQLQLSQSVILAFSMAHMHIELDVKMLLYAFLRVDHSTTRK